jgi:hypothetical protein
MLSYEQWLGKRRTYIPTEPDIVSPQMFSGSTNNYSKFGVDNRGRNEGKPESPGETPTLSYGLPVRCSFKEYIKLH